MTRAVRAELVKILRRRVLIVAGLAVLVFAAGAAAIVLTTAEPAATASPDNVTVEALSDAGGGTEVFRTAASFAGFFVFVVFIGAVAVEFGRGTFRTMLLHQPRRLRLLAGKMVGLLAVAAGLLALGEILTWLAARAIAPTQDIATSEWISLAALGAAVVDYAAILFWVTGYAVLGMTLAVLIRSVPIALGVGIAWAGPFEHLLQEAWATASDYFPGLLLEAFVAGGSPDVTAGRALLTLAVYTIAAAAIGAVSFARRDAVG